MLQASFSAGQYREAGLDEVGRGCLAGPVVAAAVILPPDYANTHLRDSKQLSAALRQRLASEIQQEALAWAIGEASVEEIDRLNILRASHLAMHRALDTLVLRPELLLIDGNRFAPYDFIPYHCIVKGDDKFLSIAAASVLAKQHRDSLMHTLATQYPVYDWAHNVGYPTPKHREALAQHGASPWHRRSFRGANK